MHKDLALNSSDIVKFGFVHEATVRKLTEGDAARMEDFYQLT
jgi:hypothetical protein